MHARGRLIGKYNGDEMARAKRRSRRDTTNPADETSETAPMLPKLPKAKDRRSKAAEQRFNSLNAVYGDSAVPPFPIPD